MKSTTLMFILVVALLVQALGSFALAGSSRVRGSLMATEEQRMERAAQYLEQMAELDLDIAILERDLDEAIARNPDVKNSIKIKKAGLIAVGVGFGVIAAGGGFIKSSTRLTNTARASKAMAIGRLYSISGSIITLTAGAVAAAGHAGSIYLDKGEIQTLKGQIKTGKTELAKLQAAFEQLLKGQ